MAENNATATAIQTPVGKLTKKHFGPLWKYIKDDNITDIDWDSKKLWIQRVNREREHVEDDEINEDFMVDFARRVGNHSGFNFNKVDNVINAETERLRIVCIHDTFSLSGTTVAIRKSLPKLRFNTQMAIEQKYADAQTLELLVNCVLARKNFIFGGEPGMGKTELAKYLSSFIPSFRKVLTIEDVREWHYQKINPGKSCIELKVDSYDEYESSLSMAVRLNPSWLMVAETRGREVRYLLEAWTNGIANMTTLHVKNVRSIPERIVNMMGEGANEKSIYEQIHNDEAIGILVDKVHNGDGTTRHRIAEIGFFYREDGENKLALVMENGVLYPERLPQSVRDEIERKTGKKDPFKCEEAYVCTAPLVGDVTEDDLEYDTDLDKPQEEAVVENEAPSEAAVEEPSKKKGFRR